MNSVYDIFAVTDEEFSLIFPEGQDVAFIDEVYDRGDPEALDTAFTAIWSRRIPKREANGIHGLLVTNTKKRRCITQPEETKRR